MRKRKIIPLILILALMIALLGCGVETLAPSGSLSSESTNYTPPAAQPEESSLPLSSTVNSTESGQESAVLLLPDHDVGDEVTPYQFLYLLIGNAEELSFTYTITRPDSSTVETRSFQRMGDASVECYTAPNMEGKPVSVRELEVGGKVHYIMDEYRMVKTYLAPAEDFLLYQMIEPAKTAPDRAVEEDGFMLYEHSLPFKQDEVISYQYHFYMKDDTLKKLTVALGDAAPTTYEFSEFEQKIIDPAAFEYPAGYDEQSFDYSYTSEYMPPWWEIKNN